MNERKQAALYAMAEQDDSPQERDNARAILSAKGMWPPPPKPPAPPIMGEPEPYEPEEPAGQAWTFTSATTTSNTAFYHNGRPVVQRPTASQAASEATAAYTVTDSTGTRLAPHPRRFGNGGPFTRRP